MRNPHQPMLASVYSAEVTHRRPTYTVPLPYADWGENTEVSESTRLECAVRGHLGMASVAQQRMVVIHCRLSF